MRNEYNLKSTNIRSTTKMQVEHMNVKLNMKDINKISAKEHFKCIFLMIGRKSTFLRKCVSMKLMEVSLSCIHFSLMLSEREVKSLFCGD